MAYVNKQSFYFLENSMRRILTKRITAAVVLGASVLGLSATAGAQDVIKIGEINSYKAQPAFLDRKSVV